MPPGLWQYSGVLSLAGQTGLALGPPLTLLAPQSGGNPRTEVFDEKNSAIGAERIWK